MLLYNVPKKYTGFTLVEMAVTAIVIGVLAAIAVPNFLGLYNQTKVKDALAQVEGALKEGQRQAIRRGRSCTININPSNRTITATPTSCLPSNRDIDSSLTMKSDQTGTNFDISFSYKGNVENSYTIVLYSNNSATKKCVYVADGLGIIKQGDYQGDVDSTITSSQCILSN